MDIQKKLQELKDMHAKGLISPEIYAEQQKSLLSHHLTTDSSEPRSQQSPVAKQGWPLWRKGLALLLALMLIVVVLGVLVAYKVSHREGKGAINQPVAHAVIAAKVIPWVDRADTAARKVVAQNGDKLASSILSLIHPTGKEPSVIESSVSKLRHSILVEITVGWKGGLFGSSNKTTMSWEINESNHVSAKIISDTATWKATAKDADKLDDYFKTSVYPLFSHALSGVN